MPESRKEKFVRICSALIEEALVVEGTKHQARRVGQPYLVNNAEMHGWWGKVLSLGHQLGSAGRPWQSTFENEPERNTHEFVQRTRGILEAIKYEIENDHLESFTQIVRAETLADLLDQAEHLLSKNYHLAAGVIGRAVLEEHLRNTCVSLGCLPDKAKPTINDYNMSLYKCEHYAKTKMKHIETLASIGNNAAHNKPELGKPDVEQLLRDLPSVIDATGV